MAGAVNGVIGSTHPGVTWTIQSTNSAQGGRFHDLGFLAEGSLTNMATSRPGCLVGPSDSGFPNPTCWVLEPSSGLTCTVRAGVAVVERTTKVGSYVVVSETSVPVTLATADATNSRIDRVDLQVLDGALGDNGGVSLTQIVVTTGVASGTPAVPAAPANSIPLAQVLLPATTSTVTTGMISFKRKSTALRGTIRPLLEGDLLTDPGFMVGEMRDTVAIGGFTIDRTGASVHNVPVSGNATTTNSANAAMTVSAAVVGHSFIAPASGTVRIGWGANCFHSLASGSTMFIGASVAQGSTVGSGTVVSAITDASSLQANGQSVLPGYRSRTVTGLTPGSTYNMFLLWHESGGGTATAANPYTESQPA
jgi:hypothetical protein